MQVMKDIGGIEVPETLARFTSAGKAVSREPHPGEATQAPETAPQRGDRATTG
jgi:hypothetical protein